jgi:Holliday junction resolvase
MARTLNAAAEPPLPPRAVLPAPNRSRWNYRRGAEFERRVADALRLDGYLVYRSAGSHGEADLVALKAGEVLLVQCKLAGPGGVRPAEWNVLFNVARHAGAVALIAHKPLRGKIAYARLIGPKLRRGRCPAQDWTPDQTTTGETQ